MNQRLARVGLLTPLPGVGLAVGDTSGHHAVLTPTDVQQRNGGHAPLSYRWQQIESLHLDAEVTHWPHPWIGDVALPLLVGALSELVAVPETKPLALEVAGPERATRWELTPHYCVGYRRRDLRRARMLLRLLLNSPASRAFLKEPDAVVRSLATAE